MSLHLFHLSRGFHLYQGRYGPHAHNFSLAQERFGVTSKRRQWSCRTCQMVRVAPRPYGGAPNEDQCCADTAHRQGGHSRHSFVDSIELQTGDTCTSPPQLKNQCRLSLAFDIKPFPDRQSESKTGISEGAGPAASIDARTAVSALSGIRRNSHRGRTGRLSPKNGIIFFRIGDVMPKSRKLFKLWVGNNNAQGIARN